MYSIYSHSVGFGTLKLASSSGFSRVILALDPRLVTARIFWTVLRSHHFRAKKKCKKKVSLTEYSKGIHVILNFY